MTRPALLLSLALVAGCATGAGPASLHPAQWPNGDRDRYLGELQNTVRTTAMVAEGRHGAVTVAYGAFAARAGLRTLEQGGNAIDAALTTALTQVAVTAGAPISYFGILSLVYYDAATGKVSTMNAGWNTVKAETDPRTIPGGVTLGDDRMLGTVASGRTALVGGFMKGIEAAHRRFGTLPFATLFEPAIDVAERGMPVTEKLAGQFTMRAADLARLPATKAILLKPDGSTYKAGELFRQPALATTLRAIAAQGADYMYRGPWAQRAVAAIGADGGKMSLADLAAYEVTWGEGITADILGYRVATAGWPNAGGVALIEGLNLAVASGLTKEPHWTTSGPALGKALNASQGWILGLLPAAARSQLYPDLDFSPANRIRPEHARKLWEKIAAGALPVKWADAPRHSDDVVVIDRAGNMAAITHSINCVIWGKTAINVDGISIGDPASFQQAAIAEVGAGQRLPDPTETGLLFKNGQPVLAFASMGSGLHQRTFQGLLNVMVHGMTVDRAIDTPDFFLPAFRPAHKGYVAMVPAGKFPKAVLDGIGMRYEEVSGDNARFGGEGVWVAISRDPATGMLRAASHNRSNSAALAY